MTAATESQQGIQPVVIVGPTAVGKTDVAVCLATRWNGEIINADSMQVYIGMDVGTAKPDGAERSRAQFHLLDLVRPNMPFSVADWKRAAETAMTQAAASGAHAIVCGGTGMYIRALLDGWSLADTPAVSDIRSRLRGEAQEFGSAALHSRLQAVDPLTALRLHPNDMVRIERALEVFEATGYPISALQARDRKLQCKRASARFGLSLPRDELNARIDARVDRMISCGLVDEVIALYDQGYGPELAPLRSLGYKEIGHYLSGEVGLETAIQAIKKNTRRFAKRQMTWFRADHEIRWIEVSGMNSAMVADRVEAALHDDAAHG